MVSVYWENIAYVIKRDDGKELLLSPWEIEELKTKLCGMESEIENTISMMDNP